MTASEAIKILKKDSCYECAQGTDSPFNCEYGGCRVAKATRVAIQALEEAQQYRAIGTPEECRAAAVKQAEKKPRKTDSYRGTFRRIYAYVCPTCGNACLEREANERQDTMFCWNCGQKLDWSDEE